MKLNLEQSAGHHRITAQGAGFIAVDGEKHHQGLILGAQTLISPWAAQGFAALSEADIEALAQQGATITLIGTGARQRFPALGLLKPLILRGGGYEIMDTAAACRTYNILAGEGRSVIAGLIIDAA